jgi:transcriptional regulator with XRE-family HTH domain
MGRQELTAQALARKLGVSEMWVSRRMRRKTQITLGDVELLAEALGVPVDRFLRSDAPAGTGSAAA